MSQVQEQPVNPQQAAPAQPPVSSTPPPAQQQEPDIFADGFSESDISAMFDADNGGNDGGTPPPAESPEGTQPPAQQEGEAPQEHKKDIFSRMTLRPVKETTLATTGDSEKRMLVTEMTLKCRTQKGLGAITNLTRVMPAA